MWAKIYEVILNAQFDKYSECGHEGSDLVSMIWLYTETR